MFVLRLAVALPTHQGQPPTLQFKEAQVVDANKHEIGLQY